MAIDVKKTNALQFSLAERIFFQELLYDNENRKMRIIAVCSCKSSHAAIISLAFLLHSAKKRFVKNHFTFPYVRVQ